MTAHAPAKVVQTVPAAEIWGPFSPWPRAARHTVAGKRVQARRQRHAA